jgi:hypothetical protein
MSAITLSMPKLDPTRLKMFLVPCSCGTTFAVSENYDRQGTALEPLSEMSKLR